MLLNRDNFLAAQTAHVQCKCGPKFSKIDLLKANSSQMITRELDETSFDFFNIFPVTNICVYAGTQGTLCHDCNK